jgi:HEAT repeat protein
VRAAAVRALGRLRAADAAEPLLFGLATRQLPVLGSADALVNIGPAAAPALEQAAVSDLPKVRAFAVEMLGLVGDASHERLLIQRVHDDSTQVRICVATALGRVGGAEAATALMPLLADRLPTVRAATAAALGALDTEEALPELRELVRTDTFEVAGAATRAIEEIEGHELAMEEVSS